VSKLQAIVWVLAAIGIVWGTDLYNVVTNSTEINRWSLNLAVMLLFANIGIMLYLTIYIPMILKITIPWDIYCPNMIPLSTALSVAIYLLSMITFWPIWGMLCPLYITVMLVGLIFSAHFIPWPCWY